MNPLARGYSFVMYLAESAATYTIPFPYLHAEDIRVFAGDVGDAVEQSFNWTGPTTFQLAAELPAGMLVTVRRFTPRDRNLVVVADGAQLPAHDLNLSNSQLLYIIQEQIDFGTYGGSGIPGGGSGWPMPDGTTPDFNIQQIIDQLMQSPVMALLIDRLSDIDANGETLLNEIIRSDQAFDHRRLVDQRVATVETSVTTLVTDHESLAQSVTELYAQHDESAAQILLAQQALATETDARATAIQQVTAAYQDADGAVTEAINQTLATSYATKDYAQSVAQTQVEALANGSFANLQERFEALVDGTADPSTPGAWTANWTVRINGGAINGTPVIAGIGLGVDSKTGSNFIVMADRFGIVSPTYTTSGGVAQMKYPFVVGTVGGVSTVGITGQLIVDGSVTADKIKVTSLSALTANMGTVNGGTFRTFQLDANGNIINPLEFRVEMTNNPADAYPLWIGPGAKTWNNAVFVVDRSGNAKFGGTVSALNLTDQLQTQVTGAWDGSIQASAGGSSTSFTLPAPVRLGESHRPLLMLELFVNITDNDGAEAADASVSIQRLSGSTWVEVRRKYFAGFKFTSMPTSMLFIDSPTTSAQTYRVTVDSQGCAHPADYYVTSVTAYMIGLR